MTKAQMEMAHAIAAEVKTRCNEDTFQQGIIDGGTNGRVHRVVKFSAQMSPWEMGDSALLLTGPRCAIADLMAAGLPTNVALHILSE